MHADHELRRVHNVDFSRAACLSFLLSGCVDSLRPTRKYKQEEQANLLGELAMLRNHKHAHLVEFIGTAMAVERGADTVRQESVLESFGLCFAYDCHSCVSNGGVNEDRVSMRAE